jgi:hypothetical protein
VRRAAELIESKTVKYEHVMDRMKVAHAHSKSMGAANGVNRRRGRRAPASNPYSAPGGGRSGAGSSSRSAPVSPCALTCFGSSVLQQPE